jgi:hypothetical protein
VRFDTPGGYAVTETASETISADEARDAEVAAALGVGEPDEQDEGSADQESEDNEVVAELATLRRELATLRREAAARRVADKERAAKANSATTPDAPDIEAARKAGREEAQQEYGIRLASAEVRTALTGIVPEDRLGEVVEDLNLARYVGEDGEPDADAIKALREKYQSLLGPARKTTAKVNHGRSGSGQTAKSAQQQFEETIGGLLNPAR